MNHQDRQRQKFEELRQQWQDLSDRIAAIVTQLGVTTDAEQKLVLKKRRQALEAERDGLEPEIQRLEGALEAASEAPPTGTRHMGPPPAEKLPEVPQPGDEFRYDAFISYSSKDRAWVRNTLLPRLEGEGLRVCIDYRDFELGAPSLVNIENAVEGSRKTLLVLTPNWMTSEWTAFEALLVHTKDPAGRGRRILPLMVQPCQLPDRLQVFTYLDLTDRAEFDFQMQRLAATIRSTPSQPPPVEATPTQRPSPPPRPSAGDFRHKRGLAALSGLLVDADDETRLTFAVLESRLLENLGDERRYGTNETIRSERARIVDELNRLALAHLGRSFNDLCEETLPARGDFADSSKLSLEPAAQGQAGRSPQEAPGPGDESRLDTLRYQLTQAHENLRLIEERKAQYVLEVDVPLQLVKEERRLRERIAELERELDALASQRR